MRLWTLIHSDTCEPVVPFDCNEHQDQGMLVYFSFEAADAAAKHQNELYELDCVPYPLCETSVKTWKEGRG